jgi:hypothetical protein
MPAKRGALGPPQGPRVDRVEGQIVPPREAALPERGPREGAFDWVARCAAIAVEAALSKLATEEGWELAPIPGPDGHNAGWRVRDPADPDNKWVNIYTGKRHQPVPTAVPWVRT